MWEKKEGLNLESKNYPFNRPGFLLGSIAIYKEFKRKAFINDELKSFLEYLSFTNKIPVEIGGNNPGYYYYNRGVLERNLESYKKQTHWVDQYRLIISRIKMVERKLEKTSFMKYLDQIDKSFLLRANR
jgi:hypothetical protein